LKRTNAVVLTLGLIIAASLIGHSTSIPQTSSFGLPNFHAASASLSGNASVAASTGAAIDEQIGMTFTQSFASLTYNVTAVAQQESDNYGPAYLLNGLTNSGYWYQIGLSWNWAELSGGYDAGFHANYNVFNSKGSVVLPSNGAGGVMNPTGAINSGDNVGLSLIFSGGNVLMSIKDWNTGATAQVTYNSESATQFIGLSTPANANGFFSGLMTEQYHNNLYTGNEQRVQYSNTATSLSSAVLWIDEYNVNNLQLQFGNDSGVVSFSSNPTQYHSYSLGGATEAANANNLITGSGNTIQLTLSYSIIGGGTGYSSPTFSYTSLGVQQSASLTTSQAVYTLDIGTTWSVTNPLSGSTSTERWITNQTTTGTASATQTINFAYGNEYSVTFIANPTSEGSTNPSGSNWYNAGQSYSISATAVNPYFLTSWSATAPVIVSNPTATSTTMLVGGSGSVTANFGITSISLSSTAGTITQGSSIHVTGTAKGAGQSATLSVSGLPSGATSTFSTNPIVLSTSGAQFTLTIGTAFTTTSGSFTITIISDVSGVGSTSSQYTLTVKQAIPLTLGYSVQGSGSGYSAPTITYVYNGTSSQASLSNTPSIIYTDQNSQWSVNSALSGSTSSERWETSQTTSGSALSATTINFVFYHQYYVSFSYTVVGGGSGYAAPTVTAVQFGSKASETLGQKAWVDAGSQYSYTNPLTGSTQSERWDASNSSAPTGEISSSTTPSPQYYHQFAVSVEFTVANGGLPPTAPGFTSESFGTTHSSTLATTATTYWPDSGSNYNVSNVIALSQARWITNSSTAGTVTSQLSLNFIYNQQFYVAMQTPQAGGIVSPSSGWINAGNSISISNTATQGWKFEFWTGTGTGSYSGSTNSTTIVVQAPIAENATFYVGLTIVTTSGGSVSYTYGNSGSVQVTSQTKVYVSPGTVVILNANPSSLLYKLDSWSGAATGASTQTSVTVNSPLTAEAQFGRNFVNIGVIVSVVVIALIGIAVLMMRRKPS
jgi:hypothetical protein